MYTHLTQGQRCLIYGLKASSFSLRSIAKEIAVNVSTVSRELSRNSSKEGYNPNHAEICYKRRRCEAKYLGCSWTPEIRAKVMHGLAKYCSPEQIAGYLKRHGININHETIYQYIWQDKKQGGTLHRYLRRKGKKYQKRSGKYSSRGLIPGRVDIEERPRIVETKSRIGDWEGDTVVGADRKGAIVTLVDRCSKIALFKKVESNNKELVTNAIVDMLKPYKKKVHTITFDNGKEFAGHQTISKLLKAKCYFAKPYHSWERGLNEHTNGLLRQFIPKKTNLKYITDEDIAFYQNLINNRPRKILNYNTPIEVFTSITTVALRN
jgi:transposase, IS30 family